MQKDFEFFKNIPKTKPKENSEYQKLSSRTPIMFQNLLNNIHNKKEIISLFKSYNLKYKEEKGIIIVNLNNIRYAINDFNNPVLVKL